MKTMRMKQSLIVVSILITFVACATLTLSETYLTARNSFNTAVEGYLDYYDQQDELKQFELKEEIDPRIKEVNLAFKVWKIKLDNGTLSPDDRETAIKLKNDVIDLITEAMTEVN